MAKKKDTSSEQKLNATVKQLRTDLEESEAKRAALKRRAVKAESSLTDLQSRLRKAEKQAKAQKRKRKDAAAASSKAPAAPSAPPVGSPETPARSTPDDSWTVAELRAEARRRGISGLSGKPKAELVKALA